jgi:uncharacterized membrane protein YjfL (UPF0719 family)
VRSGSEIIKPRSIIEVLSTTSATDAFTVLLLVYVPVTLIMAWRHRRTDERARMTLAYWASVGIAVLLAAAIVIAVVLL